MKKSTAIFCFLIMAFIQLPAQDKYLVEIQYDKKIINVQQLGLSDATPLTTILSMVPELIGRDEESMFENYDIQFDGKSISNGRDAILFQTTAGEIKKIEISSNPTVSQQKNGQCGTINVIPIDIKEGLSGTVMADATTEFDVMPKLLLNYRKNKLELRGNVNMEYYNPSLVKETITRAPQQESIKTRTDSTMQRYFQQTARVDLRYHISSKDEIKAWVLESWYNNYSNERTAIATDIDMSDSKGEGWHLIERRREHNESTQNNLTVSAIGEYSHEFEKGAKFITSLNYNGGRLNGGTNFDIPNTLIFEGKFENIKLLDRNGHNLFMKVGLNTNYDVARSSGGVRRYAATMSAFSEFKYVCNFITANIGVRYMYHDRDYSSDNIPAMRTNDDDITASAAAVWQIKPHNALKLAASRNLIRPTDEMLYPGIIPGLGVIGNPRLNNTYVHNIELGYIFDWSENGHFLTFNVTTGYDRTDGIIEKALAIDGLSGAPYSTYRNSGVSNILKDNLALIYKHGIFTLAFDGNFFYNIKFAGKTSDYHGYYNLSLTPIFSLPADWTISGILTYNSAVVSNNAILGDRFFASARLGKAVGSWTFDLMMGDIFGWRSTDRSFMNDITVETTKYDARSRYAGLCIGYKF